MVSTLLLFVNRLPEEAREEECDKDMRKFIVHLFLKYQYHSLYVEFLDQLFSKFCDKKLFELKKMKIFSVIYKSRKTLKSFNFLKFEQILL